MIHRLEELSANAWPGLRSVFVDGWILRFAEGYARRSNSVLPFYAGTRPLAERILLCENLSQARGVKPTFKLTPATQPEGLDRALEARGYEQEGDTNVMVLDSLPVGKPMPRDDIRVSGNLEADWLDFFTVSNNLTAIQSGAARAIMEHIVPARRFVRLEREDGIVACALVVVENGWAGIFDVVVRKDLRGKGLGRRIMAGALAEAAAAGAQRSYLQVVRGNRPAEELYRSLGYGVAYPYWYRVLKDAS